MIVVSFGGGTNSTAMLVGMYEKGINPDAILFADTGGEKPHTYDHLKIVDEWLNKIGFPEIIVVKSPNVTLEEACLKNKSLPSVAYGGFKTCSQRFKIQPQEKWLNNWDDAKNIWLKGRKITKAIGFDAGEPQRAKKYDHDKYTQWFPLLDWDWGREECIEAIDRAGLPQACKSSCFFCPNMRQIEIRDLQSNYPELAIRAINIEENADLENIKGLGRNYSWKQLLKQGEFFDFPEHHKQMPCGCYDGD